MASVKRQKKYGRSKILPKIVERRLEPHGIGFKVNEIEIEGCVWVYVSNGTRLELSLARDGDALSIRSLEGCLSIAPAAANSIYVKVTDHVGN